MNDAHEHRRSYEGISLEKVTSLFARVEALAAEHKAHFHFDPDFSAPPYCGMASASKKVFFKLMSAKIHCQYDVASERLVLTVHEKPSLLEISVMWRAIDKMIRE